MGETLLGRNSLWAKPADTVYGMQFKKLGLATFGVGGGEVATFGRSLLSGGRYFRDLLAATKN